MATIVVDPENGGVFAGSRLPPHPNFIPTPIRDRIGEPLDDEADAYVIAGKPYLLFANWDYAEDWSGEYVCEVHPFLVVGETAISRAEFWRLVTSLERR